MSFPDIYLEPINRSAAMLFARKDVSEDQARGLATDLREQLSILDKAIASINGQLQTRTDEEWEMSARRALRGYIEQKKSILGLLKTARVLLDTIRQDAAQKHALEKRRIASQNISETEAALARSRKTQQKDRLERIKASNEETNRFNVVLRRIIRQELGEETFDRLIKLTRDSLIGLESE